MITRITGKLVRLVDDAARIEVGHFEYEVFVPEFVRRQLQPKIGKEISLRTLDYIEGTAPTSRLIPRLVGFLSDAELEFFEMICSVDGMGVKKTLRAMVRPVREVAEAIEEQSVKDLSMLPGIGPAMAERIVAKLRRKMARFALMIATSVPDEPDTDRNVFTEGYEALMALGHSPQDAREQIDSVRSRKKKFKDVQDLLTEIYLQGRE